MKRALLAVLAVLALLTFSLTGCAEIDTETDEGYQPASLSEPDENGVRLVELTKLASERIELKTAPVRREGGLLTVPYEALVYDGKGGSWVYGVVANLKYKRSEVNVVSTEGKTVFLSKGPKEGSAVVTQGSTQVYGAEVEMSGKH